MVCRFLNFWLRLMGFLSYFLHITPPPYKGPHTRLREDAPKDVHAHVAFHARHPPPWNPLTFHRENTLKWPNAFIRRPDLDCQQPPQPPPSQRRPRNHRISTGIGITTNNSSVQHVLDICINPWWPSVFVVPTSLDSLLSSTSSPLSSLTSLPFP